MRRILLLTVLLPWPALAEQIDVASRIAAVTLYPYGAQVTREAGLLPQGQHEVRLTGLPAWVVDNPQMLRLVPGPGVRVDSVALAGDAAAVPPATAAQTAARDQAARRMAEVQAALAEVAQLEAALAAAEARQGFLLRLGDGADLQAATVDQLAGIAALVGDGVAAAAAAAVDARVALVAAEVALDEATAAWDAAKANPDAAPTTGGGAVLDLQVTVEAGAGPLQLVYFAEDAGWQPVYDLRLMQGDAPSLLLDRGVSVAQATGEDWTDVRLTLSTADLFAQSVPGTLYPDLRRIVPAEEMARQAAEAAAVMMDSEPVIVAEAAPMVAMLGDTVTYVFPGSADVPTGAASLRLSLGEVSLPVDLRAHAVPRRDATAFLMARMTNASGETLLPGEATLTRDGALIGTTTLPRMAPGQEETIAFGAIEGLRLTRDMPVRSTGERGLLVGSTEMQEVAVLQVENLSDRAWDVRLIDQVPYAEQEELAVTWSADMPTAETDLDGQRGILAWDFRLAPGGTQAVTLTTVLEWPDGQVLQE
jgi:uncharacterized protein (TIGR02231 family)